MTDTTESQQIMLAFICFVFYFAPTFNASSRKHPAKASIFLLNLFLGWTLVGWVAALVWSASPKKQDVSVITGRPEPTNTDKYQALERLAALKDKGALSQQEYDAEKAKLLG